MTEVPLPPPPPLALPTHRNSTAVLILGILSVLACGLLTGIPGIVMGAQGLRDVRASQGAIDPGALKPGLVLSIIGTVFSVLMAIAIVGLVILVAVLHRHHVDIQNPYTGTNT